MLGRENEVAKLTQFSDTKILRIIVTQKRMTYRDTAHLKKTLLSGQLKKKKVNNFHFKAQQQSFPQRQYHYSHNYQQPDRFPILFHRSNT